MALTGRVKAELKFTQLEVGELKVGQSAELAALREPLLITLLDNFAYGDAEGQINVYWHDRVSFLAAETKTFTLDDGSMVNPATGLGVAFENVVVFYIKPATDDPRLSILVNQDFGDSWNTAIVDGDVAIPGGGYLLLIDAKRGWGVPSGQNKLRLSGSIEDMDCDVLIVGRGTQG